MQPSKLKLSLQWPEVKMFILGVSTRYGLVVVLSFLTGCSLFENATSLGGGYKLITVGGNTLLHQPPNVQLVYDAPHGKRIPVWRFIVNVRVMDKLAVFNGGLSSDSRRWVSYPALLSYTYQGPPVEFTELVIHKHCDVSGEDFSRLQGNYYFRITSSEKISGKTISLIGWKLPGNKEGPEHFDVSVSAEEMIRWISVIRIKGEKREYDGITYFIAKGDELDNGAKP